MARSTYTRNSELRQRQSLGRQRKQADTDPYQLARAMVGYIRKRLADGQSLPTEKGYPQFDSEVESNAFYCEMLGLLEQDEWDRAKQALNPPKFDVEARLREQTDERTEARWQVVYPRTA